MKKWNFDFVNGKPLPGRYEWVELDEQGNEVSEPKGTNGINAQEKCAKGAENNGTFVWRVDGRNNQSGRRIKLWYYLLIDNKQDLIMISWFLKHKKDYVNF